MIKYEWLIMRCGNHSFYWQLKKWKKNPLSKRDRIFRHVSNSKPENQSIWKILCGVSFGSIFFLYSELFFVDCVVENSFALLAAYFFVFPPLFFLVFCFIFACFGQQCTQLLRWCCCCWLNLGLASDWLKCFSVLPFLRCPPPPSISITIAAHRHRPLVSNGLNAPRDPFWMGYCIACISISSWLSGETVPQQQAAMRWLSVTLLWTNLIAFGRVRNM